MISTLLLLMLMGQKEAAKHPVAALSGYVTDRYSIVYAQKCGEGKPEWVAVYADAQMKILLPNPLTADSSGNWTFFTNVPTRVLIGKPGTGKGVIAVECFDPAHVPPTGVPTIPSFTTEKRISDREIGIHKPERHAKPTARALGEPVWSDNGGFHCDDDIACRTPTQSEIELHQKISDLEKRVKELDSRQRMHNGGPLLCDNCFDGPKYDPSKPTIARKPSYDTTELCGENRHLERWSPGDVGIAVYPIALPPGYQPSSTSAPQGDSHPDKCVEDKPAPKPDVSDGTDGFAKGTQVKTCDECTFDRNIKVDLGELPKSYSCTSPSGARLICGEGCKDCKEVVIPFPDGSALYKTVPDKSK